MCEFQTKCPCVYMQCEKVFCSLKRSSATPVKKISASSLLMWSKHLTRYLSFRGEVRLRLSSPLGKGWRGPEMGIPQGCLLSMVFFVALYAPWCRHLESFKGVSPQLHADNLECNSNSVNTLLPLVARSLMLTMGQGGFSQYVCISWHR